MIRLLFLIVILACSKKNDVQVLQKEIIVIETDEKKPLSLLKEYKLFLNELDNDDLLSLNKAIQHIDSLEVEKKSDLYFEFTNYFYQLRNRYNENIESKYGHLISLNYEFRDSINRAIEVYGFSIGQIEEHIFISEKKGYLAELSQKYLSKNEQFFFSYLEIESEKPLRNEIFQNIETSEIFKRLRKWEELNAKLPNFYFKEKLNRQVTLYSNYLSKDILDHYLESGIDVFSEEDRHIYENYINQKSNSESYIKIKMFYDSLKNKKFNLSF